MDVEVSRKNFSSLVATRDSRASTYICVGRCGVRPFVGCPTRWEVLIKIVPRARAKETDSQGPAIHNPLISSLSLGAFPKYKGCQIFTDRRNVGQNLTDRY